MTLSRVKVSDGPRVRSRCCPTGDEGLPAGGDAYHVELATHDR